VICLIRQSLAHISQTATDVMKESIHSVVGLTPRHLPLHAARLGAWVAAAGLFFGATSGVYGGVVAMPTIVAVAPATGSSDNVSSAMGNHVAAGMNEIPNIESPRFDPTRAPISLTATDADSLLPESTVTSQTDLQLSMNVPDTGQPLQVATPRPVVIPFPTAAHLFVPGAAIALYSARRMGRRHRRLARA
jgi:hypothetical protein